MKLRLAHLEDCGALSALIARSLRGLSHGFHDPDQVEGPLRGACGVDTQLIRYPAGEGVEVEFVPMWKELAPQPQPKK